MLKLPAWADRRHRCLHMTIRDIDCADFDVADCIAHFQRWRVTLFSFFAGGYVTTYPTQLDWQKVSTYLAPGRDLCGELIEAAHRAGMVAFPMIDLGELPQDLAQKHPHWAAQQADGSFYEKTDGIIVSCALGEYRREKCRELAREMKERYGSELDGLKWGGASYGLPPGIDHNPLAIERFEKDTGQPLPADAKDPVYRRWRTDMIRETAAYLREVVHEEAGVPVVGNSVWHLGGPEDMENLAGQQDFTQVEIQTRTHNVPDDMDTCWQRFSSPIETSRYVALVANRAPWEAASYFLAWPWRRVAVPFAEQYLYLAQVFANGGSAMVNMTTGAPQHHEDKRGFAAIERLFNFVADNEACFENDRSAARIAILYHHASANAARDLHRDYLDELQAWEDALDRRHLPYDIASLSLIADRKLAYAAVVLPAPLALTDAEAQQLLALQEKGCGVVISGRVGTDANDPPKPETLSALLHGKPVGERQPFNVSRQKGPAQAYLSRQDADHPLCVGIEAPLIAAAGHWQAIEPAENATIPVSRAEPFRLFPEGLSYADEPDPGEPMVLCGEHGGRGVYFAFDAGRCYRRVPHPDNEALLVNAVQWAAQGDVGLACVGHMDVRISLRQNTRGLAVHLVNTTGRDRFRNEFVPVREVSITVDCVEPRSVRLGTNGPGVPYSWNDGKLHLVLNELEAYEIIQINLE